MTYRQRLTLVVNAFPRSVIHYPVPAHRRIAYLKQLDTSTGRRTWRTALV
jgi:hypothetical protein